MIALRDTMIVDKLKNKFCTTELNNNGNKARRIQVSSIQKDGKKDKLSNQFSILYQVINLQIKHLLVLGDC